jgi:hypothetical protein
MKHAGRGVFGRAHNPKVTVQILSRNQQNQGLAFVQALVAYGGLAMG